MIRRLITERDVSLGLVRSPLVLDGETLLTPAARDRAAVLGWVVVERDAAPAAPAAPPLPAVACARCGGALAGALPDGLYLVRLQGGRAVFVLPGTGPGASQPSASPPAP